MRAWAATGLPRLTRSSSGCFCLSVFYLGWQDLHVVVFLFWFFTLVGKIFMGLHVFVCFFTLACGCFVCLSVSISLKQEGAGGSWKTTCVMQNSGLGVDMLVYLYHMLSASSRPGALVLTRKHQAGWWVHHLPILHHHQTHHINMFGERPIFGFWRTTNCAKYKKGGKIWKITRKTTHSCASLICITWITCNTFTSDNCI